MPLALRLSEGLGTRRHLLEHVDIGRYVAELDIQRMGLLVVPEHVQRDAAKPQASDFLLERLEGTKCVTLSAVLWGNKDVKDIRDLAASSFFGYKP